MVLMIPVPLVEVKELTAESDQSTGRDVEFQTDSTVTGSTHTPAAHLYVRSASG